MKNLTKAAFLIILAYLILPTGDPSDIIITLPLIAILGFELYLLIAVVLIIWLYRTIDGRTLSDKFESIKRSAKRLIKI